VNLTAQISGRTSLSRWDFGDGTVVSNRPYASHSWTAGGAYDVVLRAYNETYPDGVSATVTVQVVEAPVHYVALESGNPLAPYHSWATAATNIQDAVDAAIVGGLVLVSNGVYHAGVVVAKPATVRSANGPEATVIDGEGALRCVYLGEGAALVSFTLTNGAADNGGGVWCASASAVVSNCVLSGDSAYYYGGGAYQGTLNNCILTSNTASNSGGGVYGGALNNCIVYYNTGALGANYDSSGRSGLNYCCTTPLPGSGPGNFTNAPLFVDQAGGNLRL